jgi:hypothetical protein
MGEPVREIDVMAGVDIHSWGPTEPDEMAVLSRLYGLVPAPGGYRFAFRVGSLAPNSVAAALNEANKWIGTHGRPNTFTRAYAADHGSAFLTASWCDMFQTYVAKHAVALSMIPRGDRAYTPWHAGDFESIHRARPGTVANVKTYAVPGSLLFFDWSGSNTSAAVDHVGMVVKNLGDGRVTTVEGNTSDSVAMRVRGSDVIAVVCSPAYTPPIPNPTPPPVKNPNAWPYAPGTIMKLGWTASAGVKKVQARLNVLGYRPVLITDGDFGVKTENAVRWFQNVAHISVDGQVGPQTWGKLFP